ncbi:hypothetical protein K402DRAFT_12894 [Aulographum hederae CBS 113979]|uniref:HECT-type E3 ubiquitin transferase n=1 Tax=Aulographum hederae CBS 113979 TaxID=1176131 RepID=A0A6G1H7P6_9PEZI|nr:hypothetical protein K402DRAFT_12894 [Aulographum hederae CBS 113979]
MGKILKTSSPRHEATLSSSVSEFIEASTSIPLYQLPAHLSSFPRLWPFPRGDLFHWIAVLNRFDGILELFNNEYELSKGPQCQPFTRRVLLKGDINWNLDAASPSSEVLKEMGFAEEGDRELVEQILFFTKLLLENCGNRSLYASSAHLDHLLNSSSLSLLNATLALSLRLAQRYYHSRQRLASGMGSNSQLLHTHYQITQEKVQKMASSFARAPLTPTSPVIASAKGKEKTSSSTSRVPPSSRLSSSDLVAFIHGGDLDSAASEDWGAVSLTYYESPPKGTDGNVSRDPAIPASPVTPTPSRRMSNLGPNSGARQPRNLGQDEAPATPSTQLPRPEDQPKSNGPRILDIALPKVVSTPTHELFKEYASSIPEDSRYELMNRLRVSRALSMGPDSRKEVVALRLLAVSNLAYVYPESVFSQKISHPDSEEPRNLQLPSQLATLISPPNHGSEQTPIDLQVVALTCLEALSKQKSKQPDVFTALSVSAGHGVLFYVVRKCIAQIAEEKPADNYVEDEWREALFSLLNSLPASTSRAGDIMVTAGLLGILVDVLKLRTATAERVYPKILSFLDTFVYNLQNAFNSLVDAEGLAIIAELTAYQVQAALTAVNNGEGLPKVYKTQMTDYQIPFYHQQTLRWLFKFINHLMSHNPGTHDRLLRTLMDSSALLGGLRKVLSNAPVFGSTVWSSAVNILSSFIHNEPTSYNVIAEAGLSRGFLEAVTQQSLEDAQNNPVKPSDEEVKTFEGKVTASGKPVSPTSIRAAVLSGAPLAPGILPIPEAIQAVPQAFGAICLNESGMKLFQNSGALEKFFQVFLSKEHVKALDQDHEYATSLGTSMDELVRHHPPLKSEILSLVHDMVVEVDVLCFDRASQEGAGVKIWVPAESGQPGRMYVAGGRQALKGLEGPLHKEKRVLQSGASGEDVEMLDAEAQGTSNEPVSDTDVSDLENPKDGPTCTQYISVACRFLNAFFGNASLCSAFIEEGGLEWALDFATLPCLQYKFSEIMGYGDELTRLIQILCDQKPHIALPAVIRRLQHAVDELQPLMSHNAESPFFAQYTQPSVPFNRESSTDNGTIYAKALLVVHILSHTVSTTFSNQIFSHRSNQNIFTQVNLADEYVRLFEGLGLLQRSCIWEEILLQKNMSEAWESKTRVASDGFGIDEADNIFNLNRSVGGLTQGSETPADVIQSGSSDDAGKLDDESNCYFKNTRTLRYLLSQIPTSVTPLFHSIGKMLLTRRNIDGYQRQNAVKVAEQLAVSALAQIRYDLPRNTPSAKDRYAYWIIALTSISNLMIDDVLDRSVPSTLTLILQQFKLAGGLETVSDILRSFFVEVETIMRTHGDEEPQDAEVTGRLNLALGGVKSILTFYSRIINAKYITEAPQTQSMVQSRDRNNERGEPFNPGQFLVELRYAVVDPVEMMWMTDVLDKATPSIVKTAVEILRLILEGDHEAGAYRDSEKVTARVKPSPRRWSARSRTDLESLSIDFDRDLALEALYRCYDNATWAREYCRVRRDHVRSVRHPIPEGDSTLPATPRDQEAGSGEPSTADTGYVDTSIEQRVSQALQSGNGSGLDFNDTAAEVISSLLQGNNPEVRLPSAHSASRSASNGLSTPTPNRDNGTEETKEDASAAIDMLGYARERLQESLIDRCLDVLNVHEDVTFELADLICSAVVKALDPMEMRGEITTTLIQSIISLQSDDPSSQGKKIGASCQLLALVLRDREFYNAALDELKDNISTLLGFIKISPVHQTEDSATWIGQLLLIVERLLAEEAAPRQVPYERSKEGEPLPNQPVVQLAEPIISRDEKHQLFEAILTVLPRVGKNEGLALSLLRTLALLTRNRRLALDLGKRLNIQKLFIMVKQLSGAGNEKFQGTFLIVLRHIFEDDAVIRQVMRSEIQSLFDARTRQLDIGTLVKQLNHLVLRSPEIFVEVVNEKLHINRFSLSQKEQTLALKPDEKEKSATKPSHQSNGHTSTSTEQPQEEKPKTSDPTPKKDHEKPKISLSSESADGVIDFLVSELLAYKLVEDGPVSSQENLPEIGDVEMENGDSSSPTATPEPTERVTVSKKSDKPEFKADEHTIYIYRCFLLQCMTELLASYNRAKVQLINLDSKSNSRSTTPSKHSSRVLKYLLNDLIPMGTLTHAEDLKYKKRAVTSNWAINVVVAICHRTGELPLTRNQVTGEYDEEPELREIRKIVLDHGLRAYQTAQSSAESLDFKYSRLLGLSDLFNKMLSEKAPPSAGSNTVEEMLHTSQKHLARLMFKMKFINALTSSVADIDLNFPQAKRAVKYILRPLKHLTQTAVDFSMHVDVPADSESADEASEADPESEMEDAREETPDLFRNSTLGILDSTGRSESSESDQDDDEEMYDDGYGEEIEYDDEMEPDNDEVMSEEDEDMGHVEGLPGDVNVEIVVDADGDEIVSDDEDDDDDDDDDEDMDEDDDDDHDLMDEVTAEDEDNSLPGADDEDWGTDEETGEDFPGQDELELQDDLAGVHHPHGDILLVDDENQMGMGFLQHVVGANMEGDMMEDEMNEEDDEEDEEEDYDEDDIVYEPEFEDDEDGGLPPMQWHPWDGDGQPGGLGRATHHHHHTHHHRNPWSLFAGHDRGLLAGGRAYRPGGTTRQPDDGTNPLLQRSGHGLPSNAPPLGGARTDQSDWVHQIEGIRPGRFFNGGDGPVSFISNLINAISHGPRVGHHELRLSMALPNEPPMLGGLRRIRGPQDPTSRSRDDPTQAVAFTPSLTRSRWQEESRIMFGGQAPDKALRVVHSILRVLAPAAFEADRARKKKEAEERKAREAEQAEREAKEKKEREEREEMEKREKKEREEALAAAAEEESAEVADETAAENIDESATAQPSEATGEAADAAAPRVVTTIRGREVDITHLGIDMDVLREIPEEMREEVLFGHALSRPRNPGQEASDINREFLDALPPEIREELLQQEAEDRRRREREEARRAAGGNARPAAPEEMDPADFFASLDPALRQSVLMDQDETMLGTLPPNLAAEARALSHGERRLHQLRDSGRFGLSRADRVPHNEDPNLKKGRPRTVDKVLDKAGVATLLRLMFIPIQGSARTCLNGILKDVCENKDNRAEVISLLLSILQDGSSDVSAVERSFAQLSIKAKQQQSSSQKTPQPPLKRTLTGQIPVNSDMSPMMVVQQCLTTLVHLTQYNGHMAFFFLTEHDLGGSFKSRSARKGKGKDTKATRYPLNALLGLLDRKLIVESSHVMEQLASLLESITSPLRLLLKKDKEKSTEEDKKPDAAATADPSAPAGEQLEHIEASPDVDMTTPDQEQQAQSASPNGDTATDPEKADEKPKADEDKPKKPRSLNPPDVPEYNLSLIVNIMTARECNGKTFRDTLSVINNLSSIPEAKEVFARELIRQAQDLGQSILKDLEDLVGQILKAKSDTDVQGVALAKFSPASSDQTKLLRVMTALDYLFDPKRQDNADKPALNDIEGLPSAQKEDILTTLYENSTFGPLWAQLSTCLTAIRKHGDMLNVATILLPLIEVLMVVCKNTNLKDTPAVKATAKEEFSMSSPPPESRMENMFFTFTEDHRKILNELVRNNPKLMTGNFSVLVKNSKVLEFDNKRSYFTRRLHHRGPTEVRMHPTLQLNVRRDQVFLDSFKSLYYKSGDEMKYGKLNIRFSGEEGVDAGGVTREWFQVLAKQMFNPDYVLFNPVAADRTTFHPNPASWINAEHLTFFKFIGRVIGKALYENRVLDCHFSRAVYKQMLGKPVNVKDMESIDLEYYKSLVWMLENDITDIITETFSVEREFFGDTRVIDLKENGRNIPVTEDNKQEYVRLVVENRMVGSVEEQMSHFLKGFHDLVPAELISIFNEQELELLISGLPDINIDDWKNNTEYHNYTAASPQIQWFWRAIRTFDKEEQAKLLQFVTGTSKVPLNGFKELEGMNGFSRFNIHRDFGSKDRLPSSHTCFNQLDLPEYESYEQLRQQLYTAMTAGSEYFGFA